MLESGRRKDQDTDLSQRTWLIGCRRARWAQRGDGRVPGSAADLLAAGGSGPAVAGASGRRRVRLVVSPPASAGRCPRLLPARRADVVVCRDQPAPATAERTLCQPADLAAPAADSLHRERRGLDATQDAGLPARRKAGHPVAASRVGHPKDLRGGRTGPVGVDGRQRLRQLGHP